MFVLLFVKTPMKFITSRTAKSKQAKTIVCRKPSIQKKYEIYRLSFRTQKQHKKLEIFWIWKALELLSWLSPVLLFWMDFNRLEMSARHGVQINCCLSHRLHNFMDLKPIRLLSLQKGNWKESEPITTLLKDESVSYFHNISPLTVF